MIESSGINSDETLLPTLLWDTITAFRLATVLVGIERSGLRDSLKRNALFRPEDHTHERLLKAGTVLGVFTASRDETFQWSPRFALAAHDDIEWKRLLSIIRHQISYLQLVDSDTLWDKQHGSTPATQANEDPQSYKRFLAGVAASHRNHAVWLANLPQLQRQHRLADIGGGLGTYSIAWVESSPNRTAVVLDLPKVEEFLPELMRKYANRLIFVGTDLSSTTLSIDRDIDVILFANVLHLVPRWSELLAEAVEHARVGAMIAIFEADPKSTAGKLFDLQVHLRSGCTTALIAEDVLMNVLQQRGINNIHRFVVHDADDPFRRDYVLLLGEKPGRR